MAHFRVGEAGSSTNFERYLDADRLRTQRMLPISEAEVSSHIFEQALRSSTEKYQAFLSSDVEMRQSYLNLGKIQSGKTANLMGTVAWATDTDIAAVVIFTGITGSLNDQTYQRVLRDLGGLTPSCVRSFLVPTERSPQCSALIEDVLLLASARQSEPFQPGPLPVLVAMKNRARIGAVRRVLDALAERLGPRSTVLVIDDEADQASQNSRSRTRAVAATYRSMAALRTIPMRNLWLSYTATPQALLLTDRFGALRPDFINIVPPRPGYFGLEAVMSSSFSDQRVVVSDVRTRARNLRVVPDSLIDAVYFFALGTWVRQQLPNVFYTGSPVPVASGDRLSSTQMLIHESGNTVDHDRMYRLVVDEWGRFTDLVESHVVGRSDSEDWELHVDRMSRCINQLDLTDSQVEQLAALFWSPEGQIGLLALLRDTRVLVVNADATSPTSDFPRPVNDDDYSAHPAWILIGGDILGRGITIPQLTVSYFLRISGTPNLDTVLQQLRFCGYRRDYQPWIRLFAPDVTFEDLEAMNLVETIVWNRATNWAEQDRNLKEQMPAIFYVAPAGARFNPTRLGVMDPNISDRRLNGEILFQSYDIFNPSYLRTNLQTIREWLSSWIDDSQPDDSEWLRLNEVPDEGIRDLLTMWVSSDQEMGSLEAVSELFNQDTGELGLSDAPRSTVIRRSILDRKLTVASRFNDFLDSVQTTRKARIRNERVTLGTWLDRYSTHRPISSQDRALLAVAHVGAGQRALHRGLPYDATTIIIEPILGLASSRQRDSVVAAGLGIAILSPGDRQIRTMGHR